LDKIINHKDTRTTTVSEYPLIQEYLSKTFPSVDLSGIIIYLATPKSFYKTGFDHADGLFDKNRRFIIVQDLSKPESEYVTKSKFNRIMNDSIKGKNNTEDVLMHEILHAISCLTQRSSNRYTHAEEEFAYTNSVQFYRYKKMTDDIIVNLHFLPFCCKDIINNHKDMLAIMKTLADKNKITKLQFDNFGKIVMQSDYYKFLNKHADIIVPEIVEQAKKKAFTMIDLYNKYGISTVYQTTSRNVSRFANIDTDTEV
jgi:hypothetical protein